MFKTKQKIEQLIKKQNLLKIPLWNKKILLKEYNSLSNKDLLDIVYSLKYKTYGIINSTKPYDIMFYMIKQENSDLAVLYIENMNKRIKALY